MKTNKMIGLVVTMFMIVLSVYQGCLYSGEALSGVIRDQNKVFYLRTIQEEPEDDKTV